MGQREHAAGGLAETQEEEWCVSTHVVRCGVVMYRSEACGSAWSLGRAPETAQGGRDWVCWCLEGALVLPWGGGL